MGLRKPAHYISCCLTILFLTLVHGVHSQKSKRTVVAASLAESIRIDGIPDEPAWNKAEIAGDFTQVYPFNGQKASFPSEVRFLYDNSGLYVNAKMVDPFPDSVLAQLGLRDATNLNADYFMVGFSPFNDGINAFCFQVYASDVQADFKLSGLNNAQDYSWDAVWLSKAKIMADGWSVEMKIPYSAIRFPTGETKDWGVNCERYIRRYRESSSWNPVDNKVTGLVNQSGLLTGIRNLTPPLRLSLTPYLSGYLQNSDSDPDYNFSYNFGADLKYGINESFTLDMTLIPDFGQVKSDDIIYNFSPFEVQYTERRQFFTEGTELFSKGDIFYSRRIGYLPEGYNQVNERLDSHEVITDNPVNTKLINATKLSGRTSGGLGIGLFNAISGNTWATATDTIQSISRKILSQGFTNYNMLVLDQNLKNNSYIDFLNTNFYMPTEGYMANVSGTAMKFANQAYTHAFSGSGFISQKYHSHAPGEFGYSYSWSMAKIAGNFRWEFSQSLQTDRYDPNDMGYNPKNNFFSNDIILKYNIYDPFWKLLTWYNSLGFGYNTLARDHLFTSFSFWGSSSLTTVKHLSIGLNTNIEPMDGYDYYEPRVTGRKYRTPASGSAGLWISTDYRKKFAMDFDLNAHVAPRNHTTDYEFVISPRYRINDHLFLVYEITLERYLNDIGYVDRKSLPDGSLKIIFGRRDRQVFSNVLEANYMIHSNMSFDLRARHYWVTAPYLSFYILENDGSLTDGAYEGDPDVNSSRFNLDLAYIWNFAPGSQVSVVWKNLIKTNNNDPGLDFFGNLRDTFASHAENSFSIRLLYYLDALYLKRNRHSAISKDRSYPSADYKHFGQRF